MPDPALPTWWRVSSRATAAAMAEQGRRLDGRPPMPRMAWSGSSRRVAQPAHPLGEDRRPRRPPCGPARYRPLAMGIAKLLGADRLRRRL